MQTYGPDGLPPNPTPSRGVADPLSRARHFQISNASSVQAITTYKLTAREAASALKLAGGGSEGQPQTHAFSRQVAACSAFASPSGAED